MTKKIIKTTKSYFFNLVDAIIKEDLFGMASEMAYMLCLGIFPFFLFFTAIFGLIGKSSIVVKMIDVLSKIAPSEVIGLFKKLMGEITIFNQEGFVVVITFLVMLFLASNVMAVIIKGLNRSNKIKENRSFIHVRILSVVMVFVQAFFLFFSVNLIVFGKVIIDFLSNYTQISQEVLNATSLIRWPVAFCLLFVSSTVNYYVLPARDYSAKRKSVLVGALFFCIFWLLGSWLFSLYVNELGTYNKVYGTLGAFAILLVWLYYTSIIILIGGEINNHTLKILTSKKD